MSGIPTAPPVTTTATPPVTQITQPAATARHAVPATHQTPPAASPTPAASPPTQDEGAAASTPASESARSPQSAWAISAYLATLVRNGGSDLHLKAGAPPMVRVRGQLLRADVPPLAPADVEQIILESMNAETRDKYLRSNEADYAIYIPEIGRFRVNAFRARGNAALVARHVAGKPVPLAELGVPEVLQGLSLHHRGLVLVTGPTGSGKQVLLSTRIPTPSGYTTMGELNIGDQVLGSDGRPCRVTYMSPVDQSPELYRLTFSDGQTVIADRDHQWLVASHHDRSVPRTRKRRAAIARHESATRAIDALERFADEQHKLPSATATELHDMLRAAGLDDEFPTPERITAALKMVDCPSTDATRNRVVHFSAQSSGPARRWDTKQFLTLAAGHRRTLEARAIAQAALARTDLPSHSTATELADLLGVNHSVIHQFATRMNLEGSPSSTSWSVDKEVTRQVAVTEYPTSIAIKSLAMRLRQRYSVPPSSETHLSRMTVGEILASGLHLGSGHTNFAIPLPQPLALPETDLRVPPYVLGAWLGDGDTAGAGFTQNDHQVDDQDRSDMDYLIAELRAEGYGAGKGAAKAGNRVLVQGLLPDLRAVGVIGRKHIPEAYLRGSSEQRLALLQGIMDTDGSIDQAGCCELSLSDRQLAGQVLDLIRSLGIKASVSWDQRVSYIDQHGERIAAKDRHRIHFTTTEHVFRLPRKARRVTSGARETARWNYIVDVEPVLPSSPEYGPARCITVDSPDHTYLCGDGYLVTSNTTTLSGMIDLINENRHCHVLTLEDPIEIMHVDKAASVNQREMGSDTADFKVAMKAAMRQDPDVILIGEMRDPETVHAAVSAAQTGHFVMSTLHTTNAKETINRVIDFFEPHEQKQIRIALAQSLQGIVCQRLVPKADGTGRVCVMEIMIMTEQIREAIIDPEKTDEITDMVAKGHYYGMQTFDQHLVALVKENLVSIPEAKSAATDPHDLSIMLKRAGIAPDLVDA